MPINRPLIYPLIQVSRTKTINTVLSNEGRRLQTAAEGFFAFLLESKKLNVKRKVGAEMHRPFVVFCHVPH